MMNSWHNKHVRYPCRYRSIINISASLDHLKTLNYNLEWLPSYRRTWNAAEGSCYRFTSAQFSLRTSNRLDAPWQVWRHVDEVVINIWKILINTRQRARTSGPQLTNPSWMYSRSWWSRYSRARPRFAKNEGSERGILGELPPHHTLLSDLGLRTTRLSAGHLPVYLPAHSATSINSHLNSNAH